MAETIVGQEGYQQFDGLNAPSIDAIEDAIYKRILTAQDPEEARAAYDDLRAVSQYIGKVARGE